MSVLSLDRETRIQHYLRDGTHDDPSCTCPTLSNHGPSGLNTGRSIDSAGSKQERCDPLIMGQRSLYLR